MEVVPDMMLLPHVNEPPAVVSLTAVARRLATTYSDVIDEEVPEALALIAQRLDQGRGTMDRGERSRHIALIVEDDPHVRELATALLEETELDVLECGSAEEALSYLQMHGGEVAMIFADVRLSGPMDGVSLAKAVRKLWPTIKVVLTSGYAQSVVEELPPNITFMPKPWRALEVLVEADQAVNHPASAVA